MHIWSLISFWTAEMNIKSLSVSIHPSYAYEVNVVNSEEAI